MSDNFINYDLNKTEEQIHGKEKFGEDVKIKTNILSQCKKFGKAVVFFYQMYYICIPNCNCCTSVVHDVVLDQYNKSRKNC